MNVYIRKNSGTHVFQSISNNLLNGFYFKNKSRPWRRRRARVGLFPVWRTDACLYLGILCIIRHIKERFPGTPTYIARQTVVSFSTSHMNSVSVNEMVCQWEVYKVRGLSLNTHSRFQVPITTNLKIKAKIKIDQHKTEFPAKRQKQWCKIRYERWIGK